MCLLVPLLAWQSTGREGLGMGNEKFRMLLIPHLEPVYGVRGAPTPRTPHSGSLGCLQLTAASCLEKCPLPKGAPSPGLHHAQSGPQPMTDCRWCKRPAPPFLQGRTDLVQLTLQAETPAVAILLTSSCSPILPPSLPSHQSTSLRKRHPPIKDLYPTPHM